MAKLSGSYEITMMFSLRDGEEAVSALSDKFKSLIEKNATIDKVEEWGKRRLAYEIDDQFDAYYLYVEFTSKPEFPAELDRVLKITDGVMRSLIVSREVK
jgi:small subunit ribosomal protein S6